MSARMSTECESVICSGAMYAGVPTIIPAEVTVVVAEPSLKRAIPRSASFGVPSAANMMFAGLMSRWTTCMLSATASALATRAMTDTASSIG